MIYVLSLGLVFGAGVLIGISAAVNDERQRKERLPGEPRRPRQKVYIGIDTRRHPAERN